MTDLEIAAANFADADEMAAWAVGHARQLAALDKAAAKPTGAFRCPMCGRKRPQAGSTIRHILGSRHRVCGRHRSTKT